MHSEVSLQDAEKNPLEGKLKSHFYEHRKYEKSARGGNNSMKKNYLQEKFKRFFSIIFFAKN